MFTDKQEPTFTPGTYAWFHFANKGKEFRTPEGIRTKLEVFNEFRKNTHFLEHITDGKSNDFIQVDKPGWKNGVLV